LAVIEVSTYQKELHVTSPHPAPPEHLVTKSLLRLPQMLALLGIKKSCFYAGIKSGIYPKPLKIGPRVSAWPADVAADLLDRLSNPSA